MGNPKKAKPKAKAPATKAPARAKAKAPAKKPPPAKTVAKKPTANRVATKVARPAAAPPPPAPPAKPALQPLVRPPPPAPPPAAKPPPPSLAETPAALDVVRLCRYGERFGAHRLEIQPVPTPLAITTGKIAVSDAAPPSAAARKSAFTLARPLPNGRYRCTLSVAHVDGAQRVAAAVLHGGRGPVARWVIAHADGKKPPRSADDAPAYTVESGAGAMLDASALGRDAPPADPAAPDVLAFAGAATPGKPATFVSYWGRDAEGYPACLVTDFAVFSKKDWKAKPA